MTDDNYPPGTSNLIEAPYNSDEMPCPECVDGYSESEICWFCDGASVISEMEYKDKLDQLKQ